MDFAGDYSGKKKLQNQRDLAAEDGRADNLYDDSDQFFQKLGKDLPRRFREDGAVGNPLFDTALGRSGAWRRLSM